MSKSDTDAALLREAWEREQRIRSSKGMTKLLQKELARKHRVSAGMISHYITGREPLNVEWQLRFAEYLGTTPADIWPDFPYKNIASREQQSSDMARQMQDLDPSAFEAVQTLLRSLPKKKPGKAL